MSREKKRGMEKAGGMMHAKWEVVKMGGLQDLRVIAGGD